MYEKIVDENPYETPYDDLPSGSLPWEESGSITIYRQRFLDCMPSEKPTSQIMEPTDWDATLMQGLADGYFVLPYTIGDYLSNDIRTGTHLYGVTRI